MTPAAPPIALPQALAAIDMALWDLAGKRAGRPVCELLADAPARRVAGRTRAVADARPDGAVARGPARGRRAGYRTIKLKVGLGDDLERVRAVRDAIGPEVALRLDANGAWSARAGGRRARRARAASRSSSSRSLSTALERQRALRERVPVRIAIDESSSLAGALTARVADAISSEDLAHCGGIGGLLAAASLVRASGAEVYISSTYDGPLGIAAALHAAAALAPLPPCGLATLELFDGEPSPFPVIEGAITVPRSPGLGV